MVWAGSLVLLLAGPVAGGPRQFGHGDRADRISRSLDQLELDPEVRAQIDQMLEDSRAAGEQRRQDLRDAHEQLRALLETDTPGEAEVFGLAEEIGVLRTEAHKQRLSLMLGVQELLTPEQRAQLRAQREERRARMRERHEGWRAKHQGRDGDQAQ